MAFDIDSVKSYGASAPDGMIQGKIDAFADTYACLTSSYSAALADDIANSYIAGNLIISQGGQVTAKKAPNGASKNYKSNKYGDSGEYDHPLIKQAYEADTANCLPVSIEFYIGVGGTVYEADNPAGKPTK